MREIKFRAWDCYNKKMIHHSYHDGRGWMLQANNPHFILMQYTGLHDKNGKEIYEGDVIRIWYYTGHGTIRNESCGPIYFNRGAFTTKEGPIGEYDDTEVEIIGNIYEHPELLEETEK